jgi:hypothetical protein
LTFRRSGLRTAGHGCPEQCPRDQAKPHIVPATKSVGRRRRRKADRTVRSGNPDLQVLITDDRYQS